MFKKSTIPRDIKFYLENKNLSLGKECLNFGHKEIYKEDRK